MIDWINWWKKAAELKKIIFITLIKTKELMKINSFKVASSFGDGITKDSISPEQITKPNNF